jgi:hypothetical protein
MPPPPPTFPYGYTPYPPRYAQSSQTPTSGPIYQPSAQFAAPPPPTPAWKQEGSTRYSDERSPSAPYGESVKRHLDLYDLEASLNEVRHLRPPSKLTLLICDLGIVNQRRCARLRSPLRQQHAPKRTQWDVDF